MCNFWDRANLFGLQDMYFGQIATCLDAQKRSEADTPQHAARSSAREEKLEPPITYRAVHTPFVFVRAEPWTAAPMLGILRPTSKDRGMVKMGVRKDGWLRTAEPFDKGKYGWVLEDGTCVGLGILLERVVPEPIEAIGNSSSGRDALAAITEAVGSKLSPKERTEAMAQLASWGPAQQEALEQATPEMFEQMPPEQLRNLLAALRGQR